MTEREDILSASRVDLVLILLPIISHLDAAYALAASGVPFEVAARVLSTPAERLAMLEQRSICSRTGDQNQSPVHDNRT